MIKNTLKIPALFWKNLSEDEFEEVMTTGKLSRLQTRRLLTMMGVTQPNPDLRIEPRISEAELRRVFGVKKEDPKDG